MVRLQVLVVYVKWGGEPSWTEGLKRRYTIRLAHPGAGCSVRKKDLKEDPTGGLTPSPKRRGKERKDRKMPDKVQNAVPTLKLRKPEEGGGGFLRKKGEPLVATCRLEKLEGSRDDRKIKNVRGMRGGIAERGEKSFEDDIRKPGRDA